MSLGKLKYMLRKTIFLGLILFAFFFAKGQIEEEMGTITINGVILPVIYTANDTIILAEDGYLSTVNVTAPRKFLNNNDRWLYYKYRRYAAIVYPYAKKAIGIFRRLEEATADMNNRDRNKVVRKLKKELKDEFKDPLKKLTKLQGRILVEMVEKELETNLYDLLKEWNSGFSARFWHTLGSMNEYDLKEPYIRGKDPILDMVLDDFDLTYGYDDEEE